MKKAFKCAFALLCCAVLFVSCSKNYGDDIDELKGRVSTLEATVISLQSQIDAGAVITSVTPVTDGVKVVLSNGKEFTIQNGKDGQNGQDGKDGSVVTIGENGNWLIDGKDTGLPSRGKDGIDGKDGQDGKDGIDGKDGQDGKDGIDGKDGQDGKDGKPGIYYVPNPETGCFDMVDPSTDPATVTPTSIKFLAPGTVTAVYGDETITFYNVKGAESGKVVINLKQEIGYISLYSDEMAYSRNTLNFYSIVEKGNTFTAPDGNKFVFVEGNTLTSPVEIGVRVSPTNAKLNPDNIQFINSQGEALKYVKVTAVKEYEKLLTKASLNNGLYVLTVELEENVADKDLKAAIQHNGKEILFAIAVNNNNGGRVISGYNVRFAKEETVCHSENVTINGTAIEEIHNRGLVCEETGEKLESEKVWLDEPAVKAIASGANKNIKEGDNRDEQPILAVVKGEPIEIAYDCNENGEVVKPIKGFYVKLDEDKAVSSKPSELNAWKSYVYENLGKLYEGNTGSVTIKDMKSVEGDVIGFRVFAVNMDGTLVSPYGRSFYVQVGNAPTSDVITATILADKKEAETDYIETKAFVNCEVVEGWTLVTEDKYAKAPFSVKYFDSNKKEINDCAKYKNIKYVKFCTTDIAEYIDGQEYEQTLKLYNMTKEGVKFLTKTITAKVTKVMPTDCPEIKVRPAQQEESGIIRSYMVPVNGYDKASDRGMKDLNNIFYEIDKLNLTFTFANTAKDKDGKYTMPTLVSTPYELVIDKALIDNKTEHMVTVSATYNAVSRKSATSKVEDYLVTGSQKFTFIFACWENANKYAWVNKPKDLTPILQWKSEGNTVAADMANINVTNSYNNEEFGGVLAKFINNKWLRVVTDEKHAPALTVDGMTNPYFKVSISGTGIEFTQIGVQSESAPVKDHNETLTFYVQDAFGHITAVTSTVVVKAPEKK